MNIDTLSWLNVHATCMYKEKKRTGKIVGSECGPCVKRGDTFICLGLDPTKVYVHWLEDGAKDWKYFKSWEISDLAVYVPDTSRTPEPDPTARPMTFLRGIGKL